jgi:hypothetical protein
MDQSGNRPGRVFVSALGAVRRAILAAARPTGLGAYIRGDVPVCVVCRTRRLGVWRCCARCASFTHTRCVRWAAPPRRFLCRYCRS